MHFHHFFQMQIFQNVHKNSMMLFYSAVTECPLLRSFVGWDISVLKTSIFFHSYSTVQKF